MSEITKIRSHSERGNYDLETLHELLDEALICHVSFLQDGQIFNIPMLYVRNEEIIILHSSAKGRIHNTLSSGSDISIAVTLLDGIVVAKSAFHSSMNYRSAVIFGQGKPILDIKEKMNAARLITEKMIPGRWDDCRKPKKNELESTGFLSVEIKEYSCKERSGSPIEDPADIDLPYWSGNLSTAISVKEITVSKNDKGKLETPGYIRNWAPPNKIGS